MILIYNDDQSKKLDNVKMKVMHTAQVSRSGSKTLKQKEIKNALKT